VGTLASFRQIPQAKVTLQLHRIQIGNGTGHGDSSFKRTGRESSSRPGVHLNKAPA
jgi:hypothetical protein